MDTEDELQEIKSDAVPSEVRDWLASTFTQQTRATGRRSEEKPKFRSIVHAVQAGIFVERSGSCPLVQNAGNWGAVGWKEWGMLQHLGSLRWSLACFILFGDSDTLMEFCLEPCLVYVAVGCSTLERVRGEERRGRDGWAELNRTKKG